MLRSATEEIAKSDELWKNTAIEALREQQETDFGLWGPYKFEMPQEEGKWDSVTTNSPKVLANKIMGFLEGSWLQLYIDVGEEKEKERERISKTERLANGSIWAADRRAIMVPSGKKLQGALSAYAVLKGGTVKSVYWYTKGDALICDIKHYDPEFSQWIEGEEELLWFCYRNYVSKEFIERTYKKQIDDGFKYGDAGTNGRILSRTFWDGDEWRVAINGEYVDDHRHGLGYIPINVRSCGSAPYMQSVKYEDTMRWSWTSCYVNTRDVYNLESKLLSIESSKATDSGRKDIIGEYDSVKSEGQKPSFEKLGYGAGQRNNVLLLDAAKGYKFIGFAEAPDNRIVDQLFQRVKTTEDIIAGLDPIAFGQMTRSGSGALAAELRSAALEFITPFRECVEEDFKWIAHECVKQYKNGEYEKVSVEGRDSKKERFRLDITPADVEEKRFDCELVADRLRDEGQELGLAIQKVSYGLTSRRTARLQHNIVDDPDREQDIMDEEEAAQDPIFMYEKRAKYFEDKGEDEMALAYHALSKLAAQRVIQEAGRAEMMMGQEEPPKPPVVSPQMDTARIATQGMRDTGV